MICLPLVHTFEKERSLSKGTSQEEQLFIKTMKGNRPWKQVLDQLLASNQGN